MLTQLRICFNSGYTLEPARRIPILKALKEGILSNLSPLYEALWKDLHKSEQESYLTEISFVLSEIEYHIRHLKKWSKPRNVSSGLILFPSRSRILPQPYGTVLIVAPWNYPFMLLFAPLVAAISAGNCVLLKPSHLAVNTAAVCQQIIERTQLLLNREPAQGNPVELYTGGPEIMERLLKEKYDYIFYTGGPAFGKTIAVKAAETLTPVTLELGGKSPCILTKEADLKTAARKIIWGKFLNSGQTCVAPDYLLVEESVKEELLVHLKKAISALYGPDTLSIIRNPFYGRIISPAAFDRLDQLVAECSAQGDLLFGGTRNRAEKFIEPTLVTAGDLSDSTTVAAHPAMREEIFGPILPMITFSELDTAIRFVNARPKPLALYVFAPTEIARQVLGKTFSGGACINDTLMHIANRNLPFGGVGESGMGSYHGKFGFDTFSHQKSCVESPRSFDLPVKYPPYKGFGFLKKLV